MIGPKVVFHVNLTETCVSEGVHYEIPLVGSPGGSGGAPKRNGNVDRWCFKLPLLQVVYSIQRTISNPKRALTRLSIFLSYIEKKI